MVLLIFEGQLPQRRSGAVSDPSSLARMNGAMALFDRARVRQARIETLATAFQGAQMGSSEFDTLGLTLRRHLIDQLCDVANAQLDIRGARGGLVGPSAQTAGQLEREMGRLVEDAGQDLAAVNRLLGFAVDDVS